MRNDEALNGTFSFPKWAMAIFMSLLLGVSSLGAGAITYTLKTNADQETKIQVLQAELERAQEDRKDIKEQLGRIENEEKIQHQTLDFILQNLRHK